MNSGLLWAPNTSLRIFDSYTRGSAYQPKLPEDLGVELSEGVVCYRITDLDRVAADFTVFDIALPANRKVQDHRNLFSTIRTDEGVFH
jgi:hypothetical protein